VLTLSLKILGIARFRTEVWKYSLRLYYPTGLLAMLNSPKEYHLVDLLTGESLGGFVSLAGARDEARAASLTRWDIFRGNVRIERHDPGMDDLPRQDR
jgi:hypothetical protein